jgi:predicted transcriptional regulator of viral defense system
MVVTPTRPDPAGLETHALTQGGYFDRSDARQYGFDDQDLYYHTRTGRFERVHPGVYRLRTAPVATHDDLLRAWVWTNYRGAVSHESALALYGLSDVMPGLVHLTVPPDFARNIPPAAPYVLHRSDLDDTDVTSWEGLRVTAPARSIVDAAASGTEPDQIERAVREALGRALTTAHDLRAAAARRRYRHRRTVQSLIEHAINAAASTTAPAYAPIP